MDVTQDRWARLPYEMLVACPFCGDPHTASRTSTSSERATYQFSCPGQRPCQAQCRCWQPAERSQCSKTGPHTEHAFACDSAKSRALGHDSDAAAPPDESDSLKQPDTQEGLLASDSGHGLYVVTLALKATVLAASLASATAEARRLGMIVQGALAVELYTPEGEAVLAHTFAVEREEEG